MNADNACAASGWATGQKAINGYREGQANPWRNRLPRQEALQRLEPCAGKLASTVLRGGSNGNVALLPD